MGLSLAPVKRQYLPRRAPSIMSSVDDPNPARGKLEPGEWMGGSAGGCGAARSITFTSRTANYCGLEHPACIWYDEGNAKDEMAGLPPPSQAIPAACSSAMASRKTRPPSTCFRGGATRFKGLHVPVILGRGRKLSA